MPGVTDTTVGYTGGRSARPTYRSVCGGDGVEVVVTAAAAETAGGD